MAGPWDKYAVPPAAAPPEAPWEKYGGEPKKKTYPGTLLPLSRDDEGNVWFDSNAGLFGVAKRAFNLPGEVMRGEIDPKSDEGIARVFEMGTIFTPINPMVRAGDAIIPGVASAVRKIKPKPPTADALKEAGGEGFEAARNMGVEYSADAVRNMALGLKGELERDGILAELAPTTFTLIGKLSNPPENSTATISGLHAARRAFGHAAKQFTNPTEQAAAERAIAALDRLLEGSDAASVVAGPAAEASVVFKSAKANYAAGKRSDLLNGMEESAELRAAAANSGRNLGNTLRQRAASLLLDPKRRSGFSADELAAIEEVARGTAGRNTLRFVGNLLGGGGGLGAVVAGGAGGAAGGYMGGLPGLIAGMAIPAAGVGAKSLENALTQRAFRSADELVRSRSPLYDDMLANAPSAARDPELRSMLLRALLPQLDPNGA